ncbi:MAG: hypothetical protein RSE13_21365 [Planktothrix sp. GU0601_MAG3]|nr:MAG: hypothetical protein RSE13_21365 [Planktothrix sp. GU0601_MAG3]
MQTPVTPDKTTSNPLSSLTRFLQDVKIIAQPYWYPTELNGRAFSDVICFLGDAGSNGFKHNFVSEC